MLDPHSKRRLELARWYAREARGHETMGEVLAAEVELVTAREYLSTLIGGINADTTIDDVEALCALIESGDMALVD